MELVLGIGIGLCAPLLVHAINVAFGLVVRRRLRRDLSMRSRGFLVLTYDDGPGDRLQRRLLPVLEKHGARATFFQIGIRLSGHESGVKEVAEAGHEIGSHGFAHLDAFRALPWRIRSDLRNARLAFGARQLHPTMYRPPYGRITASSYLSSQSAGERTALWTVDSGDTWAKRPDPDSICTMIESAGGGVVLLHSSDRAGLPEVESYVIEVTDRLLQLADRKGLRVVRFSELFEQPGVVSTVP